MRGIKICNVVTRQALVARRAADQANCGSRMVAGSPGTHGEQTCTRLPPSGPAHICTRSDDWKLPRTRAVERTAIGLWASGGTSNMSLSLNPSAAGGTVRAAASSRSGARLPSAERRGSHLSLLAAPPAASQPSRPPQAPQPSQPSRPSLEQSFQGPRPGSGLRSRPSSRPTSAQREAHQRFGSQPRRGVSAGRLLLHESISLRSLSSGRHLIKANTDDMALKDGVKEAQKLCRNTRPHHATMLA